MDPWTTFGESHLVLIAGRTLTSTIRLLEAMDLFRADFRLRWAFTVQGVERYEDYARGLLSKAGVHQIVPWSEVGELRPALILVASENVDTDVLHGPIAVLPHGLGFNKYVPETDGTGRRLAGLPTRESLRSGKIRLMLSHPEQDRQLCAVRPDVTGHTVVTGDPTFDRLTACLPLRERYRRVLGTGERRLVLVSSTWGENSALGAWQTILHRLVAELPADSYQVCAVLHPNIWTKYQPAGLRVLFAEALEAGLVLLPTEAGWHAAMIAAHVVIADYGSLCLHAAGLGTPLLLTGLAGDVVPETPVAELAELADHFAAHRELAAQLEAAIAQRHEFNAVTERVFAHRGQATELLREQLYAMLGLHPDGPPALLRAPDPEPLQNQSAAHRVYVSRPGPEMLVLQRFPEAVARWRSEVPASEGHLVVEESANNLRHAPNAAVLARAYRDSAGKALAWAANALHDYPTARLAVAGTTDGAVVLTDDGRSAELTGKADVSALGSVAYFLLCSNEFTETELAIQLGPTQFAITVDNVTLGRNRG